MRPEPTRLNTLRAIWTALRPGGRLVFEMGGAGNVGEAHTALVYALARHADLSPAEARQRSPWFFPSDTWMRGALEGVGFLVDRLELEYRPTKLTEGRAGGLAGWIRLMGADMLDGFDEAKTTEVVREICDVLADVCGRGDEGVFLGYVRLRGVARKPG